MLLLAPTFSAFAAADVVFIAAAMTLDTIVELADAFFNVFPANVLQRVLMASVAGVATVVVARMAGHAACVVVTVEFEMLVVVECGRRPFLLRMALTAIAGDLLVQRVVWRLVAGLAGFAHGRLQQGVVELALLAETFDPSMIAMAGDTLLTDQFLVKSHGGQWFGDGKTGRSQAPDLLWLVARQAAPGVCSQ